MFHRRAETARTGLTSRGINGRKISLIIEDSRGDKDQAKSGAKLINRTGCWPSWSHQQWRCLSPGRQADKAGVVIMGTSNTVEGGLRDRPLCIQKFAGENVIPATVRKAKESSVHQGVLLYSSNDWAVGSAKTFEKPCRNRSEHCGNPDLADGDTDFRAQLTSWRRPSLKPWLFPPCTGVRAALNSARQQGLNLPVMGATGLTALS